MMVGGAEKRGALCKGEAFAEVDLIWDKGHKNWRPLCIDGQK